MPKMDKVTGEWRRLHTEELNDLYLSPNIIQVNKNEMGWACSTYGREEGCMQVLWGNLRERDHMEDPGINGRIVLICIFRKWYGEYGLD